MEENIKNPKSAKNLKFANGEKINLNNPYNAQGESLFADHPDLRIDSFTGKLYTSNGVGVLPTTIQLVHAGANIVALPNTNVVT